jgi:hypothetical protein
MFTPSDLRLCGGGDRIRTGDFYDANVCRSTAVKSTFVCLGSSTAISD